VKKFYVLLITLLTPIMVFASSEGGHEVNWTEMTKQFGWRVLVFVVFFIIIFKLLKKPILNALDNRTKDIEKAIADAEKANEAAKAELTNYELKMKGFESDLAAMKEKSMKAAEAEKVFILEDAEKQIEKLQSFAESAIDAETKKAREQIKRQAVISAVEAVQDKLGKELDESAQKKLLGDYIKKIEV